ncbi:iron complex transport system permease protein [Aminobacter aminovorans]|uniref:Probable siderophore transport system permease protein yfhA n=1 Tax=Aminobacter aminovorans TaxID=83263 RepID=A0A380WDI2_AMIAI|nr:iron chelate uptake ABC transporter family permease subunit [Aminobacter aminovorans]TCS25331.1 iron complex transport system permease protein [Aminobacter aminovorans]SUU86981.1 Probable siderophore transport system permease protein yfhA [Aminobacter aminovorans]
MSAAMPSTRLVVATSLVGLFALSLGIGVDDLPMGSVLTDAGALQLLLVSRLPRTVAVVLTGAGLAIAGLVLQVLVRNRFVEPITTGTGQSAALGVLAVTLLFPTASIAMKTLGASVTALAGTSIFLTIAHRLPPTQPFLIPLFGLVYGGVIGAAVTFIAWQTDLLQYVDIWTNGEFSGVLRGRYELLWILAGMVALAWWVADRLTIASMGREVSVGLGLDYQRIVQLGLVMVAVISSLAVVVVGMIPFVGLVVPNLVSRLMGDNLKSALPWVAMTGAVLLLACDIIGRVIRYPYEIPVGTVLGVVGSGLFLWILFGRTQRA